MRKEIIGNCTLYHGDCLEVLEECGIAANAVIADPPYGMNFDYGKKRIPKNKKGNRCKTDGKMIHYCSSVRTWEKNVLNDDVPFNPVPWLQYPQIILWGAQHYASRLPDSNGWLIWDKRHGTQCVNNFSDCEMAWTNLESPVRIYRQLWIGMIRGNGEENGLRLLHPSQKPIGLMMWCVQKTMGIVLDPYMGSGTTGVACIRLQRPFVGIELDEEYFTVACKRIEAEMKQMHLFNHEVQREKEPEFDFSVPTLWPSERTE